MHGKWEVTSGRVQERGRKRLAFYSNTSFTLVITNTKRAEGWRVRTVPDSLRCDVQAKAQELERARFWTPQKKPLKNTKSPGERDKEEVVTCLITTINTLLNFQFQCHHHKENARDAPWTRRFPSEKAPLSFASGVGVASCPAVAPAMTVQITTINSKFYLFPP